MIMEIIVGVIGAAFVVLVVFLLLSLKKLNQTLKKADHILADVRHLLNDATDPAIDLLENTNALVLDIQKKSEGLDLLFRPLYSIKKAKSDPKNGTEKVSELMEYVAEGVRLFGKIKNEMK